MPGQKLKVIMVSNIYARKLQNLANNFFQENTANCAYCANSVTKVSVGSLNLWTMREFTLEKNHFHAKIALRVSVGSIL